MKYTGPNAEGFERDARLLLENFRAELQDVYPCSIGGAFEIAVGELAHDYGIGEAEIWDMLREYAVESK